MNLQHRNQAPRPQNRHRFDFERKSLKKPEATGSAGRCETGAGRSTAPALCPAFLSHPFCCPSLAVFNWPDTGPNSGLGGLGRVLSPPWGRTRHTGPNGGQQGASQSGLLLGAIKIPRRSRGYFIDGQSPLLLAARAQRVGTVCQPRSCYLPPVNGPSLLRCFPSSSAPPSGLHPAGA